MSPNDRAHFWNTLRQLEASAKPLYSPLLVQYCCLLNEGEQVLINNEALAAMLPFFPFGPLTLAEGGTMSQEEFNLEWKKGETDFAISMGFGEDMFELGKAIEDWARNLNQPFPFKFDSSQQRCLRANTIANIVFLRKIDRVWHTDRTVKIILRPASTHEAYSSEARFWKERGDEARAELADEIAERFPKPKSSPLLPTAKEG